MQDGSNVNGAAKKASMEPASDAAACIVFSAVVVVAAAVVVVVVVLLLRADAEVAVCAFKLKQASSDKWSSLAR